MTNDEGVLFAGLFMNTQDDRKYDEGKLRLDLIPPEVIRALGEVLTYGAGKYGDRNWEKGISEDRLYAALQRHLLAWREGKANDEESGLSSLAHALCNLAMLVTFERRNACADRELLEAIASGKSSLD